MWAAQREPALGEAKTPALEGGEAVGKADPELRGTKRENSRRTEKLGEANPGGVGKGTVDPLAAGAKNTRD